MYTAIILAAGKGVRTALSMNKTTYLLDHKPLYKHSVDTFIEAGFKVVLVINKDDEEFVKQWTPNIPYIYGGKTRSESVINGLSITNSKYVFIHDGARPFINTLMINDIKELLKEYNAVLTCKIMTNTIYDKDLNNIDRNNLIQAETPQAFITSEIKEAYAEKPACNFTDDISVYKTIFNNEIGLYKHDYNNDKITTKKDVEMYFKPAFKIGHSYDIHQTSKDRKLFLGGLQIENDFGLVGHSDADVVLHVVGECLLGALGLGDLGTHFPDTDPLYKDLDSKEIVIYAAKEVIKEGYVIENIDITVFLELPKLNPFIKEMRINIAKLLKINYEQVNIKATTFEKMDSIGKKEAIAAEAVCLIKKKIKRCNYEKNNRKYSWYL